MLREFAEALVDRARGEGVQLTGTGGLLTDLVREVLQTSLEVEMSEHLGYEHGDISGHRSGNSRNGSYPKTVTTEIGEVALQIPRDRNGTFEPATVPKYARRLEGLSGNVISLYAKGLTQGEISNQLFEMYGTEISKDTISRITDGIRATENLTLIGPAGTGKSHALIALGHAAVENGLRVRYFTAAELVENLYRGLEGLSRLGDYL